MVIFHISGYLLNNKNTYLINDKFCVLGYFTCPSLSGLTCIKFSEKKSITSPPRSSNTAYKYI